MSKKHLNFDERFTIQYSLKNNENSVQIANRIGKDKSTISREIKKYSQLHLNPIQKPISSKDKHHCGKLKNFPYVCNGCKEYNLCNYHKVIYSAKNAHNIYKTTLSCSRKHSYFDEKTLSLIENEIIERLKKTAYPTYF